MFASKVGSALVERFKGQVQLKVVRHYHSGNGNTSISDKYASFKKFNSVG
jgi:hypothetical protein